MISQILDELLPSFRVASVASYMTHLVLVLTLAPLSSCNDEPCNVIERYESGKKKVVACTLDSSYCFVEYFGNGAVESEYCLKEGKYDGEAINYYPSGKIRSKMQYESGLRQGACYKFDSKGRPVLLNLCANDKTIFLKSYKYSSSGAEVEYNFNPIFRLIDDTASIREGKLRFEVSLPIPDSLIEQDYAILKYGFKPLELKDSIVLEAPMEAKLYYNEPYIGEIKIEERSVTRIFYYYLYDAEKNAVYGLNEQVVNARVSGVIE